MGNPSFEKIHAERYIYDVPSFSSTRRSQYNYSAEILETHSNSTLNRALKSTTVLVQCFFVELATVNSLKNFECLRLMSAFMKVVQTKSLIHKKNSWNPVFKTETV